MGPKGVRYRGVPLYNKIKYSETLLREKTLVDNAMLTEKTFIDYWLVLPKDTTPPNFVEKTFTNSHKTLSMKLVKVFSLKSFPLCSNKS